MRRSRKHVVDSGLVNVASGTTQSFTLVIGTINPIPYTNPTNVGVDSRIFSLTFQLDVMPSPASTNAQVEGLDWFLNMFISGQTGFPDPGNTGTAVVNNQIIHEDQALVSRPSASSNAYAPRPLTWRLKVAIPPAWCKFGQGDQIQFFIKHSSADAFTLKYKVIFTEVLP